MAGFTSGEDGKFRVVKPSLFVPGVEFTVTKSVVGIWTNPDGGRINGAGTVSIKLVTSLSPEEDDGISLKRFLRKSVFYDKDGKIVAIDDAEFKNELSLFLENKIGRDANDPSCLKGSASEIGKRVVDEFFAGKTIATKEIKDVYKKDKDGKIVVPTYSPVKFYFK